MKKFLSILAVSSLVFAGCMGEEAPAEETDAPVEEAVVEPVVEEAEVAEEAEEAEVAEEATE